MIAHSLCRISAADTGELAALLRFASGYSWCHLMNGPHANYKASLLYIEGVLLIAASVRICARLRARLFADLRYPEPKYLAVSP